MTYTKALAALADPTRRRVFEKLRKGPASAGDLARGLPVSRPAVSQHLQVLKGAGLVRETAQGTRRIYAAEAAALGELRAYVDGMWRDILAGLATHAESEAVKPKRGKP
jgi:DNA-binding transcriptional ArsR family regulator